MACRCRSWSSEPSSARFSTNVANGSSFVLISFQLLSQFLLFFLAFSVNSFNFASRDELVLRHEHFSAHSPQEGQCLAAVPFPLLVTSSIQLHTPEPLIEALNLGILNNPSIER